jgi:hypothetical protein
VVAQVHPVDLTWYVARVEERARSLSPALVAIARDHAAFVQGMTRQRTLLERRIYIVIPWSRPAEASGSNALPVRRLLGRRRRAPAEEDTLLQADTVQRLLGDRCDAVGRQLGRAGLRATRLDDLGLAQLYHVSWAPEVARTQRLRRELADYTTLVVSAESRSGRGHERDARQRLPVQ